MSTPLEFAFPVSPTNLGVLNKNIRKWRIVQYDTGDGMLPMLVGTYQVDVTTGQPVQVQQFQYPQPNGSNSLTGSSAVTGATLIQFSALLPTVQWRLYKLWFSLTVASTDTQLKQSGNVLDLGGQLANQMYFYDFTPWGLSSQGLSLPLNQDLTINFNGGGKVNAGVLFYFQ